MVPAVTELCIPLSATIAQALEVIDRNAQGICFVVDRDQTFVGVITDGDIRRGFLKGSTLTSPLAEIVNRKAFTLPYTTSSEQIQESFTERIKHIPLLDEQKKIVDFACVHRVHRIPVMEPFLGGNELNYVTDCIKSGWISSKGSYVTQFEEMLAKLSGAPYALAVSNGTTALHLALDALGIGPGDEVIVPDFTFAASINSVLYAGATPVLVDIEADTWTISIEEIEKAITPRTKAIMPVHIYGHPCDMDAIMSLARKHSLLVVEDCAESLGSTYKERPLGSFGDAASFSFFGNKVITTGEGGMTVFKSKQAYELAKIKRDHGMNPHKRYWHEVIGYNYRMTNLQAAIGVAQIEQLSNFLERRTSMARTYDRAFKDFPEIKAQSLKPWATSCHWLYTVVLSDDVNLDRDTLIQKLLMNGIETRPTFYPLHEMPLYRQYAGARKFPNTEKVSRSGISLPSSVMIENAEIQNISSKLKDLISIAKINSEMTFQSRAGK